MARYILAGLAVVMFSMAGLAYVRGESIMRDMREWQAAQATQPAEHGGWLVLNLDYSNLWWLEAIARGEVWFLLKPTTWAILGAVLTCIAVCFHLEARRERSKILSRFRRWADASERSCLPKGTP